MAAPLLIALSPHILQCDRRTHPRRIYRRHLAVRLRHLLRWQRRLRHYGWGLWVWEPVQPGLQSRDGSAEHGAVRPGAELWRLLRNEVHRRPVVVPRRKPLQLYHRHQVLPVQLRAALRQRGVVQPSPPPLRPRHAHVPQDRRVPSRDRPSLLSQGPMQEEGRDPIHDQRL
ncbi:putative expansin-A7 [Iris pallida]|uniref:Expansin-A7 n=1 Tax=Iris pallida TaxID=29817 RepID=A0AAX6I4S8_IRIPA|nr:putative expansin-A7 [Iris pallida]